MTEIEVNPGWLKDGQEPEWLQEFRRVQIHFENALEYNGGTVLLQDIVDQIATGEMHLWSNNDTGLITQFVFFPRKKALHIPFAGGKLEEIEEMAPSIIAFAKANRCDMLTLAGRPGWGRTFIKQLGFEPAYTVMKMDVTWDR